jgi:ABC-type uncharacterized transport system fused permease/ATPase subunit
MAELEATDRVAGGGEFIFDDTGAQVVFSNVDIVTPRGQCVARAVSVAVSAARPLMVTGASATGKSSLFRVLGGLWPLQCGTPGARSRHFTPASRRGAAPPSLNRQCDRTPGTLRRPSSGGTDIFLVPQRIHMAPGSLADQVTYIGEGIPRP